MCVIIPVTATNILCYDMYPWSFCKKQMCYKYSKHSLQTCSLGNRREKGHELTFMSVPLLTCLHKCSEGNAGPISRGKMVGQAGSCL